MPLPAQDKAFLTEQFSKLEGAVKIDYFHQSLTSVEIPGRAPCLSCEATKEILEELAELSDRITLTVYEHADEEKLAEKRGIERPPGIVVRGETNRPLRLTGKPGGVFLSLLTQAILSLSAGKPPDPGGKLKATLKKLRTATDLRVVGAMMDPATGDAAIAAWLLALISDKVEVWVYNLDEFPVLGTNMSLNRIPATLIGGRHGFAGVTTAQGAGALPLRPRGAPRSGQSQASGHRQRVGAPLVAASGPGSATATAIAARLRSAGSGTAPRAPAARRRAARRRAARHASHAERLGDPELVTSRTRGR